jgi:2-polyprenyl-3-methyl-5-hydroxy-6-metoxy-1,4-benzoquinol methylase
MEVSLRLQTENLERSPGSTFSTPEAGAFSEIECGCLLCGAALKMTVAGLYDTRFGSPGSYKVYECVHCRLEQTTPRPSPAELKHLYETYYNFHGVTSERYVRWRERFFFSALNRIWSWLDGDISFYRSRGTGRLLDIGCNEGRGLRIYSHNGFNVEGLEFNEVAAASARQCGFTVHTCALEDFAAESPFDVAVLSNVLEHSLDPRRMLRDAHRILAPGGQVWISCPNSRSWLRSVFGRCWVNWHVPFHLVHFSSSTLTALLQETGFDRVEVRQITPAHWVAASLIVRMFGRERRATRALRNPILSAIFLVLIRFLLFPVLWLGNRKGRGDCLVVIANKGTE